MLSYLGIIDLYVLISLVINGLIGRLRVTWLDEAGKVGKLNDGLDKKFALASSTLY